VSGDYFYKQPNMVSRHPIKLTPRGNNLAHFRNAPAFEALNQDLLRVISGFDRGFLKFATLATWNTLRWINAKYNFTAETAPQILDLLGSTVPDLKHTLFVARSGGLRTDRNPTPSQLYKLYEYAYKLKIIIHNYDFSAVNTFSGFGEAHNLCSLELDLGANWGLMNPGLDSADTMTIAMALKKVPALRELKLGFGHNSVNGEGLLYIVPALLECPALRSLELNLEYSRLGSGASEYTEVAHVLAMLGHSQTIETLELHLHGTGMGYKDMKELVALKGAPRLQKLILSLPQNGIDTRCAALLTTLGEAARLHTLYLNLDDQCHGMFDDASVLELAAFANSSALRTLNIQVNDNHNISRVGDRTLVELQRTLALRVPPINFKICSCYEVQCECDCTEGMIQFLDAIGQ
jgi:hypothetical protein